MNKTVSAKDLKAGIEEFAYNKNKRILMMLSEGKRVVANNNVVSTKQSLIFKTTSKSNILSNTKLFEPEFAKRAGKKVNTARVFEKMVGVSSNVESDVVL